MNMLLVSWLKTSLTDHIFPLPNQRSSLIRPRALSGADHRSDKSSADMGDLLGQMHFIKKRTGQTSRNKWHTFILLCTCLSIISLWTPKTSVTTLSPWWPHSPVTSGQVLQDGQGLAAQVSDSVSNVQLMKTAEHQAIAPATDIKTPNHPFAL